MTDPLSIAASVAGIVALSGSISKFFFQFYRSIHDAPSIARDLATALYALNIALSQVQGNLLNPKFVAVGGDEQLDAIEACLASCKIVFESLETELKASGLDGEQTILKHSWASVKAYFNEEQILVYMRRVEREKTTLLIVISNFSARLQANTLIQVQDLRAQVRKQERRLKNIHVLVESVANFASATRHGGLQKRELTDVQTAAFDLASAYDADEIASLQSTDSIPSLTLGALEDRSVNCLWEPPPDSSLPSRRVESELTSGMPLRNNEGFYQSRSRVIPLSSDGISGALNTLGKIASQDFRVSEFLEQFFRGAALIASTSPFIGTAMAAPHDAVYKIIRKARELSSDVYNDLQYMEYSYMMISKHWTTAIDDEALASAVQRAYAAMIEYLQWAAVYLDDEGGKRRLRSDLRAIMKATPNATERKRLVNALTTAIEGTKDLQNLLAQNKMFEMQRELLALQQLKSN